MADALSAAVSGARALGQDARERWARTDSSQTSFAAIAAELLEQLDPSLEAVLQDNALSEQLLGRGDAIRELQLPSRFSDLQLILYRDEALFVELLHWTSGTTTVHDHAFCGAFKVIRGESLNCEYTFRSAEHIAPEPALTIGSVDLLRGEVLPRGAVRPILSGVRHIHSVFHLPSPSITLVLRTQLDREALPQCEYRGGRLRAYTDEQPLYLIKQIQALRLLAAHAPDRFATALREFLRAGTLYTNYWTLRSLDTQISRLPLQAQERIVSEQGDRPGFSELLDALAEEKRIAKLVQLRSTCSDENARFVLALLMNVPDGRQLLKLLADRFGVSDCLEHLQRALLLLAQRTDIFGPIDVLRSTQFLSALRWMADDAQQRSTFAESHRTVTQVFRDRLGLAPLSSLLPAATVMS